MKMLANHYPEAETILLVQDNLNTHIAASFYEALSPEEAFELARRFEFHYTPKKGSWLNMAEIEFSALSKQCLNRRIAGLNILAHEISAWGDERNSMKATIGWKFNKDNARVNSKDTILNCKIIVKNPKIDTYLPCYDTDACGLLVSIFRRCTIMLRSTRRDLAKYDDISAYILHFRFIP